MEHTLRLGWIGTGVMGASMAGRLLAVGYPISVHNRTRSKSISLLERGAQWCDTPEEVALQSDIVFTMVGYPTDVRQVVFGSDGILNAWQRNRRLNCTQHPVYIDCTTSSPELARLISEQLEKEGIDTLDAPVSGGDTGAQNGTLSIMVGGKRSVFDQMMPLLSHLGTNIVWEGEAGSGQNTKMVNQILIAGNMIGVCEALLYAQRNGLNMESVFKAVSSGAAGSWSLSNLGARIIADNFAPGFYIEHFIKDLGIALEEAKRLHLNLPGLVLANQLYSFAAQQGFAKSGTQALIKALDILSHKDDPSASSMTISK